MAAMLKEPGGDSRCGFALLGSPGLPVPDIILESGAEDMETKRAALAEVAPALRPHTIVLSNSSSILPSGIHDRAIGLHFFFPVALTGFAELILPAPCPVEARRRAETLVRELALEVVVQGPENAFAINRLLLPLMAEVFRQFRRGYELGALNDLSVSPLLPRGQVAVMDDVGLDVLRYAVGRYVERMAPGVTDDYRQFEEGLSALVGAGYLGKKNRRPLLKSDPRELGAVIGAGARPTSEDGGAFLRRHFYDLFINSCFTFVENGECSMADLSAALSAVFGAELTPADALAAASAAAVRGRLAARYEETGISYLKPSAGFG